MASGSLSVGGTWIIASLPVLNDDGESGIVPVTSPVADIDGEALSCGMVREATPLLVADVVLLNDCRPIGVGDVIEGIIGAGAELAPPLPAGAAAGASDELSAAGIVAGVPVSSRLIAILKVPSTITTTLAPTSNERIFEVMVDAAVA
jgi:hypothetical protein